MKSNFIKFIFSERLSILLNTSRTRSQLGKEQIELKIARERQQDLTDLNLASFENTNVKRESIIILQEREWILIKKNPGNKMVTRSQGKKISARETVLVTIVPGMKTYNQAIKSVKHVELKYATDAELASLEKDGKSHKR